MDFLQIALILLIIFLGVSLGISGWMAFLILKDTRKNIKRVNEILSEEKTEKVVQEVAKKPQTISHKKPSAPRRRFFKKVL